METISETFSEYGSNFTFEKKLNKPNIASFATTEGTTLSSYVESEGRSSSFISNTVNEVGNQSNRSNKGPSKVEFNKDKLLIQKLNNEVTHFKSLLSEYTTTQSENEIKAKAQAETIEKQTGILEEKDNVINALKQELKQKQEHLESFEKAQLLEKHKLKMKIDYLTNKCFHLNCKLDKKDYTPGQKAEKEDISMIVDILENKQKEYCDTEKNQLQDPTDFLFNIFAHYENMQKSIRKLSDKNDQLKQDLVETKVKWAESEGQKEKLNITVSSLKNTVQRYSIGSSQRDSQASRESINEESEKQMNGYSVKSFASYLPGINFWGQRKD